MSSVAHNLVHSLVRHCTDSEAAAWHIQELADYAPPDQREGELAGVVEVEDKAVFAVVRLNTPDFAFQRPVVKVGQDDVTIKATVLQVRKALARQEETFILTKGHVVFCCSVIFR